MRSRSLCTMSNCKKAVVVVWSVSLVLTAPVLITKDIQPERFGNNVTQLTIHYCRDKESMGLGFAVYQFLVLFAVPALLMIFFYSRVISELWKSTRTMKQMTGARSSLLSKSNGRKAAASSPVLTPNSHRAFKKTPPPQNKGEDVMKARKQVIKMLILVIALFLVCWGPRLIMEIVLKVGLAVFSPVIYTVRITFFLMPFIHACINPFVYCFMSRNFQRSMRRQLARLGVVCPPRTTRDHEQPLRSSCPTGTESTRHTYCTTTESVL
ncbi:cholecystokinin receptor type A-like [Pollicipes pollicipes]|uniref:cholecystokinin receptor type A-like n=1 Tax=Pollicipes pollicipes TaxID=41117 RepID=UPI001884E915|nr:cholecystokinin receptor type A-like [Pollicipes pollicipes]